MGMPGAARGRTRVRIGLPLLSIVLLLLTAAEGIEAQVPDDAPEPPDTVPGDTVRVPIPPEQISPDTIPAELREAAAAPTPAVQIPRFPWFGAAGWAFGRWEWTAEELSRAPGMTVLEFVEAIPGVTAFRLGGFGRPESVTAMGAGGGRVRVFLNGYELDPHGSGSYPLQMISLIDLRRLRVERSLAGITVRIDTFVLEEAEPASIVALGTGVYQTRLLRGLFSRGFGERSVGTAGFDLASTAGMGIGERYRHLNASLRWDYAPSDRAGLQLEWRRTVADRSGDIARLETTRGDLVLRGRGLLSDRLTVEGFVGRSGTDETAVNAGPPSAGAIQGGGGVAYASERLYAEGRARGRVRGRPSLSAPAAEVEGSVGFRPLPLLRVEATSAFATADSVSAGRAAVTAVLNPISPLTLFASVEAGSALVPLLVDRAPEESGEPLFDFALFSTDVGGQRAGAELAGGFGAIGAAAFRSSATTIAPFGLSFDRGFPVGSAGSATGAEVYFRLPIPKLRSFAIDGWYTRFLDPSDRLYAPDEIGRLAIAFHDTFVGGQLEPSFRLEGHYRGQAPVPAAPGTDVTQVMPSFQTLNFSLQLRIIDVTAFLIWDNLLANREALYLPLGPPSVPRIVYGGSWRFRN